MDLHAIAIYDETKGHPMLVKFFVFGKGLKHDVERRYTLYLKKDGDQANQESELDVMKTMLACALLDLSNYPITDELLNNLGIKEYALYLHQKTLWSTSESSWKTIHSRWCMEFFSFLYNQQAIPLPLIFKRKRYLKEAIELLNTLNDKDIIPLVMVVTHKLATLKRIPIDIVEYVTIIPDYLTREVKYDMYAIVMASTYFKLGMYNKTIEKCDIALSIDKKSASAFYNKGSALSKLGRNQEALKYYDKALELEPDNPIAWNNKGSALGKLSRNKEALKYFDKALEIEPNLADAWLNKGIIFSDLGKHQEALKYYDKALEIHPNHVDALNNKGVAFGNLDKS